MLNIMNDSYKKYITNRLNGDCRVSSQHLYAITASDYYGAEQEFYLLQFYYQECLLLKCRTSSGIQPKRIGIESCTMFRHSLNDIFKANPENMELIKKHEEAYFISTNGICQYDLYYDTLFPAIQAYNERIKNALKEIELKSKEPVFICFNENYSTKALLYALQKKNANVLMMQKPKEILNSDESLRVLHMHDFDKMHLKTAPVKSVSDCFSPQTIYVPLTDKTLNSEFYNGIVWRDLLGNAETTDCCIINGISCMCFTILMQIDIFNNVFCILKMNGKIYNAILLYNALRVKMSEKVLREPSIITNDIISESVHEAESPKEPTQETTGGIQEVAGTSVMMNQTEQSTIQERQNQHYSEQAKVYGPVEGFEGMKLDINDNEAYCVDDLFGYYLLDNGGVTEICFRDAYLYQNINLLQSFVDEMLSKLGERLTKFRLFKIQTLPKESINASNNYYKKQLDAFESNIAKLITKLRKRGINFAHDYIKKEDVQGSHKRTLIFDNGWCIDLEGGLNKLYKSPEEIRMGNCSKTTLYYYNINKDLCGATDENPYAPPAGKRCVVKIITTADKRLMPEKLFRHYLEDDGGTSHIVMRDRYLHTCPKMLKILMEKLIGFSRASHRDNEQNKQIERITLYISKKDDNNKKRVMEFEEDIAKYKLRMKGKGVDFELRELSKDDKDGDHKRCMIFEDNGWCIDMEGGIDKLYKNPDDMNYGDCQSTTLYYCKEQIS